MRTVYVQLVAGGGTGEGEEGAGDGSEEGVEGGGPVVTKVAQTVKVCGRKSLWRVVVIVTHT